jgi:HK97 family phage portal protein
MDLLSKISSLFESKRAFSLTEPASFYRILFGGYRPTTYSGESLQNLYRRNELAFACINKIADVMNDAEIIVEKLNNKDEWEPVKNHPLLALIEKPNADEIGEDLRRKMVQSENFSGICYLRIVRPRPNATPSEIYILNPNRVIPEIDYSNNRIREYRYTNALGYQAVIKPEDIIIRRRTDLTDEFYGLAPLAVAANTIDSDENLTDYVNSLFDDKDGTSGIPRGLLKFNRSLSPEQADLKRKTWMRRTNASEIQVLDDQAEFQALGIKPDEMAADSLRWQNDAKICGVFGVPPTLVYTYLGVRWQSQRAGVKDSLVDFWFNKISPELKLWRKWATWNLLPLFEDINQIKAGRIRVNYELSQMLALQENVDDIHTRARANFSAGGWTLNEFREATGKMPDAKGDYYLQPFNLSAISPENRAAEAVQKVEAGTNPNEPEQIEETEKRLLLPEKKTEKSYDFDGLTLSRKPTEVEKLIGLKSLVSDLESQTENINKSLLNFREKLIKQAVQSVKDLDDTSIHTLTLERNEKLSAKIYESLTDAFEQGRSQIVREILAQKMAKSLGFKYEIKKDLSEEIREKLKGASENLINKIINEIQARTINLWVALKLLAFDGEEFFDELKKRLFGESDKFVETTAKASANLAINAGRKFEIQERSDEWEWTEYSAILDKNLCSKCKQWDGKRSKNPDEDFPNVPNPYCEGGSNCRCFWVVILD